MPNRRKTNAVKLLEGTDRPDREQVEPPLPVAEEGDAPDWLEGPESVKEWEKLVPMLQGVRTLSEGDLSLLAHLCNLHGKCVQQWRLGAMPTAATLTQLRLLYTEFGLTPASRSKATQIGEGESENAFAGLRKKA